MTNFFFITTATAQLKLKLQWVPAENLWGVYVKPDSTIQPSQNVFVGSGQITLVAPNGFEITNVTSYMGAWVLNARANGPVENPEMDYISFGIRTSEAISTLGSAEEVLILTIRTEEGTTCPDTLHLIDSEDPFAKNPNSLNTNPGNDLQMVDLGNRNAIYQYSENYASNAWNCNSSENLSTSLLDIESKKVIKVFPNPFKEQLVFELIEKAQVSNLHIQLYDNFGRLLRAEPLVGNHLRVEVNPETALYFYQIIDLDQNKMIESGKLIKH